RFWNPYVPMGDEAPGVSSWTSADGASLPLNSEIKMFSPVRSNGNVTVASPKFAYPTPPPALPIAVAVVSDGAMNALTASAGGTAGPPNTNSSGGSVAAGGPVFFPVSRVAGFGSPSSSNVTPPNTKVTVSSRGEPPAPLP